MSLGPVGSTFSVNPNLLHQTMVGWEAVADVGESESAAFASLALKYRDALADLAVEAGINRVRLEVNSGAENPVDYYTPFIIGQQPRSFWGSQKNIIINDNADPNVTDLNGFQFAELDHEIESAVLPLKARLAAQGEKLCVNLLYVEFGQSSFEHRDNPAEYGEFMLVMFQHIQSKYGFVADTIELVLEPDNTSDDSLGWPKNTLGPAMVAAGDRLKATGYTPDFIGPSTSDGDRAPGYFDALIQTPGALSYLTEISYHRYGSFSVSSLQGIASRAAQHNLGASMLEWWSSSNTYQTLHQDIEVGRNSAWQARRCSAGPAPHPARE